MRDSKSSRANLFLVFIRLLTYLLVFITFFLIMSTKMKQLITLSRTAAIVMSSYVVIGLMSLKIYGNYDINNRKSKPVVISLVLATLVTDFVAYMQLAIMNTNIYTNFTFSLGNIATLLLTFVVQVIIIVVMVYFGNYVYFLIEKPRKVAIVYKKDGAYEQFKNVVTNHKKQYQIVSEIALGNKDIYKKLDSIDHIFMYNLGAERQEKLIHYCYTNKIGISYNLGVMEVVEYSGVQSSIDDFPIINISIEKMSLEERFVKRCMDIIISIIGILLSLPFYIIIAIAIKLEDGGKVFYTQERLTYQRRVFNIIKFRTMISGADLSMAKENDERITKVGKVLRKYRIDELPQFINILKGDMSVVGPRPESVYYFEKYKKSLPEFEFRLNVKAGLTGLAQIHGKYNTSPKNKLIFDLLYIERYSIWFDMKLILQTLIVLLKSDSTEGIKEEAEEVENE